MSCLGERSSSLSFGGLKHVWLAAAFDSSQSGNWSRSHWGVLVVAEQLLTLKHNILQVAAPAGRISETSVFVLMWTNTEGHVSVSSPQIQTPNHGCL